MSLFDEMSDNALGVKSSQANQASRFDQMSDDVLKSQQPATDEGNFTRGFKNSFRQLPQLGYGIEAIAGATGEKLAGEGGLFTGLKQHGLKNYQQETAELAPYSHENDSITTAWDKAKGGDIGALGDFAGYGLGYVAGQGAQALATAGVGKLLAQQGVKTLAPSVIEAVTAKEAAKLAGKGLTAAEIEQVAAKNALAKIGSYGANTALAANALGMEGGEIGGGMVANAEQRGTPLTGEELVKGGLSTLGAGALEYVGDKIGIDAAFGKMPIGKALSEAPGISGRVGRGLTGGAIAAVPEAGTEYGQTMLEQYGQGQDPFSAESQRQAIDAAALGALGGQVMGGVGGLLSPSQKQPQVIEKPISDGPLGNAAAAGGITTTEVIDAGQADTETQPAPGQEPRAIANPVLPATDGFDTPNVGLPGAELPADASGEATGEIPLATQQVPAGYELDNAWLESAQNFTNQEGHILHGLKIAEDAIANAQSPEDIQNVEAYLDRLGDDVADRFTELRPDAQAAFNDGWGVVTDKLETVKNLTATPITQEAINANNPDGNAVTDNSQTTGPNSGTGSDQRGFDARLEPTDGRADDRGISGVDGQLRGTELPSDVEPGGALNETSNINVSQAQTSESELPSMEDTASATGTTNTAAFVGDAGVQQTQAKAQKPSAPILTAGSVESFNKQSEIKQKLEKKYTERYPSDKEFVKKIVDSKLLGNKHLDDYDNYVESTRGKTVIKVDDPKETGIVLTRGNDGRTLIKWNDKYSAEKNLAEEEFKGKKSLGYRSWLFGEEGNQYIVKDNAVKQQSSNSQANEPKAEQKQPWDQPVLPDTGANQTGNAAAVGVGQGQSAVSGQEKVAQYHPATVTLGNSLVKSGGVAYTYDDQGRITGRTPSTNPDWFKDGTFVVSGPRGGTFKPSVSEVQKAVAMYERGEKLSDKQGRILQRLSDIATEMEQEAYDTAEANFATRASALLDAVRRFDQKLSLQLETAIEKGFLDAESIDEYEEDYYGYIEKESARNSTQAATKTPAQDELLQPINAIGSNQPKTTSPVATTDDLFASTPEERAALEAKQGVADIAREKDKKRQGNGAEPPPLFSDNSDFMGQSDIEDSQPTAEPTTPLFDKLDKAKGVVSVTHKAIKDHPNAERIAMIHNRFNDVLNDHGFEPAHNINGNLTNRIRITC